MAKRLLWEDQTPEDLQEFEFDEDIGLESLSGTLKRRVKKLATCNLETDTLLITLKAFRSNLISKQVLKQLTSSHPQVSIAERRVSLMKNIHKTLQEKLYEFEGLISTVPTVSLAKQFEREGLVTKDVLDQLSPQVPNAMRLRYLHMCVHVTLKGRLQQFEARILRIMPFQLDKKEHPLEFLKQEVELGLIDQQVLDHLHTLYPELPKNKHDVCVNLNSHLQKRLQKKGKKLRHSTKLSKLSLNLDIIQQNSESTLSTEHFSELLESLVEYAYKWRHIGIALKFHPQDLDNIQACPLLMSDSPRSYLTRLLENWLQNSPEYALPPTVENLERVLNSRIVGLGNISSELCNKLVFSNSAEQAAHLPYSSIRGNVAAIEQDNVYLKENESTLLEIDITSGVEDSSCKWLRNNKEFDQKNCKESFLCLQKVDINLDGCSFSRAFKGLSPVITVHVSSPLDQFKSAVASIYLAQPEVPEDTWPPIGNTKYINLALIKPQNFDCSSEYELATIRGGLDDILQHKEPVEYSDFYKNLKSGQLILLKVDQEVGKQHLFTRSVRIGRQILVGQLDCFCWFL